MPTELDNHKSGLQNENKVSMQITEEIDNNRYMVVGYKPLIISAIGAIPKSKSVKIRIIHDCSRPYNFSVNSFAEIEHYSFLYSAEARVIYG